MEFMCSIGETCDAHLFSRLLAEKGNLIQTNKTVKNLTFKKYDETLEKYAELFTSLVMRTIESMLQKPSALLKASSMPSIKEKHALSDVQLPSKAETLKRIAVEFRDRGKLDIYIRKLV